MKSLFIVFEGIDGSGTSTQAALLKDYLLFKDYKAVLTCEPSSGPIGNLIRESMKRRVNFVNDSKKFDEQMAYLFAADRHDHLYNDVDGVFKLMEKHINVISTRYYFSSLAYHCSNDDEFKFVKNLNCKFPKPDLVIYIDISLETALARLGNRSSIDMYENREKLLEVKENYAKIFKDYSGAYLIIDGNDKINCVHDKIVSFIEESFDV
ncbi:dTMP kinase [Nostoc sp.]|uniref:dTMP kinase n=1 Tax=Nostoc sp. TaxID=1180 RepID=UPI002FFC1F28